MKCFVFCKVHCTYIAFLGVALLWEKERKRNSLWNYKWINTYGFGFKYTNSFACINTFCWCYMFIHLLFPAHFLLCVIVDCRGSKNEKALTHMLFDRKQHKLCIHFIKSSSVQWLKLLSKARVLVKLNVTVKHIWKWNSNNNNN